MNSGKTSNVVYKPIAKLVSRTTVSLLANMVSNHICITKEKTAEHSRPLSSFMNSLLSKL